MRCIGPHQTLGKLLGEDRDERFFLLEPLLTRCGATTRVNDLSRSAPTLPLPRCERGEPTTETRTEYGEDGRRYR